MKSGRTIEDYVQREEEDGGDDDDGGRRKDIKETQADTTRHDRDDVYVLGWLVDHDMSVTGYRLGPPI